ncbi:MAG: hypothetical protein WCG25_03950 [bacterium]
MTKERKKVFTIIDVKHTTQEQKQNTIDYSINLAKVTARDLVFYFLGKTDEIFDSKFASMVDVSNDSISAIQAIKCHNYDIKISFNREETSWFQSINDIVVKENAAFILMGINPEKRSFFQKVFGKTMWSIATTSNIPVILIPPIAKFSYFEEITIAADDENKIQKLKWVKKIHQKFATKVHVFVKNTGQIEIDSRSSTVLNNMAKILSHEGIKYEIVYARDITDFENNLLRYAAQNSQLLIIEVDEGMIEHSIKKNIQKLLFSNKQQFAVMLVKTKIMGDLRWF